MLVVQMVRCPDCGNLAQRHFHIGVSAEQAAHGSIDVSQVIARTECPTCDYFLEVCMTTGQVLSTHVPSVVQPTLSPAVAAPVPLSSFQASAQTVLSQRSA